MGVRGVIDMRTLPNAGSYGLMLADPAWQFKTYSGDSLPQRAKVQHYKTMSLEALMALPVGDIAGRDCVLIMWILQTHLKQALRLGEEAWGFEYKTMGPIWHKMTVLGNRTIGMGHWFRTEDEVSLLFTRGKPKRLNKGIRQFINAPVREHSRKPEDQYQRLEKLVAGPRLELFSRTDRPGWDHWGDEAGKYSTAGDR